MTASSGSPYGITEYIADKGSGTISVPAAILTALNEIGSGLWLRNQTMWRSLELTPGVYSWGPLDRTVAACNSASINLLWNIQSTPLWYQKIDPMTGKNMGAISQTTITSGQQLSSITISPLPTNSSIATGYTLAIDAGLGDSPPPAGAEIVTVTGGPYTDGATRINFSPYTFKASHAKGCVVIGQNSKVKNPGLSNGQDMATFAAAAAKRYNGTNGHGTMQAIQIGNEEFDTLGYGGGNTYRDAMGKWLVDPMNQAYTAIKAVYANCVVGAGAMTDTAHLLNSHYQNWITNLYTYNGGIGTNCDFLDFHYYRSDNRSAGPDPAIQDADTPSISTACQTILGVPSGLGISPMPELWCNEFGWNIYDDGSCTLNIVYTAAQIETFIQHMYDGMRTNNATRAMYFTYQPIAVVKSETCSGTTTPYSTDPKSLFQTINGTGTELPPWNDPSSGKGMKQYIGNYSSWPNTPQIPVFTVTPTSLNTTSTGVTKQSDGNYKAVVTIAENSGTSQNATWSAASSFSGVTFTPASGNLTPGGAATTVTIKEIPATQNGTFTFSGGESETPVTVTWTGTGAAPVLTVTPSALNPNTPGVTTDGMTYTAVVTIAESGSSTQNATWSATSSFSGVTFSPASGNLTPGNAGTQVTISGIPTGGVSGLDSIPGSGDSSPSGTFTFSGGEGETPVVVTWTPSNNQQSGSGLGLMKSQIVMVYTAAGAFIDVWRDAPLLSGFKEAVNAATTPITVQLPRSFSSYDLINTPGARGTIAQGNIVQYYLFGPGLPTNGLLRYQGVIEAFQPQITDTGEESVIVTLVPQSSAIADHGIGGSQAFGTPGSSGTYVDPLVMFKYWFTTTDTVTNKKYTYPLTYSSSNPTSSGVTAQYTFANQSLQSIFTTILQMLPAGWFYRCNVDNSVTVNVPPTTAQHTFLIGQHIAAPSYKQDWTQLKNVIYYTGNNNIAVSVKGSDLSVFGEMLQLSNDTRITDTSTLLTVAQNLLANLDQMQLRTVIRVLDYRGDNNSGLGYDIETLKVGDTCTILDPTSASSNVNNLIAFIWNTSKWGDYWTYTSSNALNIVAMITSISYNFDYVDLELSNLQPNQDAALLRIQQKLQDYTLGHA